MARCEATIMADVHEWWPTQSRCSKESHEKGSHIEENPNSVVGDHAVIWREGEPPKVYWYPKQAENE